MSDFDREEAAFRAALTRKAEQAPAHPVALRLRRRRWLTPILAAATVIAVIGLTVAVAGDADKKVRPTPTSPLPASDLLGVDSQWIGMRGVEVKVPGSWGFDVPTLRPDCIMDEPSSDEDYWANDVPDAPYLTVGGDDRMVPTIGCFRDPKPGDPDPAFGSLPFRLWQPYVQVVAARPDLEQPEGLDGDFSYRGWTLSRATIGGVQVTVLAGPGNESLPAAVIASAREVDTTHDGCAVKSDVLTDRSKRPNGAPIPTDGIAAVTICKYTRDSNGIGLSKSRRIVGPAAADLVAAIHDAPDGLGPQNPSDCLTPRPVEEAIVLRFYDTQNDVSRPLAEANVYFDSCVGNGIVDSSGARQLTKADCKPLFAAAPVLMGGAWSPVYKLCAATSP